MTCGGSFRNKRYDANRFQKKYPIKRIDPRIVVALSKNIEMETAKIELNNEDVAYVNFKSPFSGIPATIVCLHTTDPGTAHVNIYVESITSTQAVIKTSAPVYGLAVMQAIYVEA